MRSRLVASFGKFLPRCFAARSIVLTSACLSALILASPSRAAPYQFEILAQVGDVIDGRTIALFSHEYTNVAINNDGEVAFFALVDDPAGIGYSVLTQRRFIAGAGKVVDGTIPRFNNEDHQVDINSSGQVVYTAFLPEGGRGLFVNEDLLLQPGDVIDGSTITLVFRFPQINDSGIVVVDGWRDGQGAPGAIFTQHEIVIGAGQVVDGQTIAEVLFPRIGNNGDIASFGTLSATVEAVVTPSRVILETGGVIDGMRVGSINAIGSITDTGEFPITVSLGDYPEWQYYVVTDDRILFREGDVIAGQRVLGLWGTNTVLNNRGQLALLGAVERLDGFIDEVLFAGGRVVASRGDVINGKEIAQIFPNFDMNDLGEVAFRVEFEDGSRAVILASIPEPASWALLVMCALLLVLSRRPRTHSLEFFLRRLRSNH